MPLSNEPCFQIQSLLLNSLSYFVSSMIIDILIRDMKLDMFISKMVLLGEKANDSLLHRALMDVVGHGSGELVTPFSNDRDSTIDPAVVDSLGVAGLCVAARQPIEPIL